MNKEFIPYEQVLALKELGYDEECFAYYFTTNGKNWEFATKSEFDGINETLVIGDKFILSAPLYQQAFRWFREKHKLRSFVDVRVYDVDSPNEWIYDYTMKMGNGVDTQPFFSRDFDTYEEAELACLNKLIELIKKK